MKARIHSWVAGLTAVTMAVAAVVVGRAQAGDGAHAGMPWAFVVNDPVPAGVKPPDPQEVVTVPGSSLSIPRSQISMAIGPPDWHPEGHPPMPPVVARGGGKGVQPCAYCHLPNGQGKPENSPVAGLPYEYIVQQMEDWRNGRRGTSAPKAGSPWFMVSIGKAATAEDVRAAAQYFSSIPFKPGRVRVIETDRVPMTRFAGWVHQVLESGKTEPIGTRVVETPEDLHRFELRDDAVGFIAYVPKGAIARGQKIVSTGGSRSVACTTCHGEGLRGLGPIPPLAGRSPSYLARQIRDFQTGARDGLWSDLMDAAVKRLTVEDIVDIVAYAASLKP